MKSADVGEEVSDVELARRKERRRRMREQKQKWGIWKMKTMTFFDDYFNNVFYDNGEDDYFAFLLGETCKRT